MASQPSDRSDGDGQGDEKARDKARDKAGEKSDSGLDAALDRAVPAAEAEAFLIGVNGKHAGRVYALSYNTVSLGRAADADVYIADPSVSAHHARILNSSRGFEIEDLNSTNGTFVGGKRITRTHLRGGDRVMLGQVEFNFLLDRPVEATIAVFSPGGIPGSMSPGNSLARIPPAYYPPPRPFAPADADEEESGPSLVEVIGKLIRVYRFLRQYSRLIAMVAGAGLLIGLASLLVVPPAKEAICEVKLRPQVKTNPMDPQQGRASDEDTVQFFAGAERAFTDPELVASTLKKITGQTPDDARVESIVGRLKFEPLPDHIYRATYREGMFQRNQPHAAEFLGSHLENYVQAEITKALRVFTAQADFLRDQLKSVEGDLARIRSEKVKFREKNADRLPEEATLTHTSRFELEAKKASLMAQVRQLQGELEAQRRALAAEGPLAERKFSGAQTYRDALAKINGQLTEAYARGLADGHPEVIALKEEKKRIEALITTEVSSDSSDLDRRANPGIQALRTHVDLLQAQLGAAKADLADTEKSLSQVKSVVGDLPRVEARVQQLNDTQEATTHLHAQLFEQLKKADLQLSLERVSAESRYEIVIPPQLVKKKRVLMILLRGVVGLLVGLLIAAAVVAVREGRRLVSKALVDLDGQSAAGG
jgi:uncharacterized protein involved in exopolysaccharide biosynthesis